MGVRTLVGVADGTTHAAAMFDSVSGRMLGPVVEHEEAESIIDGFLEWLRAMPYVSDPEGIGLTVVDLPHPAVEGTDARSWPWTGFVKLMRYYREHVWVAP